MGGRLDRGKMRLQHGSEAGLGRRQHALVATAFGQHLAGAVNQPQPKTAGAPVHRDIGGFGHLQSYPRLTVETPSRDNETALRKSAPGYRLLPPQTSLFSQVRGAACAGTPLAKTVLFKSGNAQQDASTSDEETHGDRLFHDAFASA